MDHFELLKKAMDQKGILLNGYTVLLKILLKDGNVSKKELTDSITSILKKHNEV